jgi:hypothetical protein
MSAAQNDQPQPTLDPFQFITPPPPPDLEAVIQGDVPFGFTGESQTIPTPTGIPIAPPLSVEASEALPTLVAARTDLELLATQFFEGTSRPEGWTGALDVSDDQLPLLVRLDLEILAGAILGAEVRPAGWFGVVPSSPLAVARDVRHDLEILADIVMGAPTLRPAGWRGDDPLMRCSRAVQSLVAVLERSGYAVNVDWSQADACQIIEIETARFVETRIIQPLVPQTADAGSGVRTSGLAEPYQVTSQFVVAWYDRNARRRAGVIPLGTGFRPIARSTFSFSNMMLVTGQGFTLFVDYTTTDVPFTTFALLPDVDTTGGVPDCNAGWCE